MPYKYTPQPACLIKKLSLIVALLFALTSCYRDTDRWSKQFALAPVPDMFLPSLANPIQTDELIQRWLQQAVCNPPCWERISPSHTTIVELQDVLSVAPFSVKPRVITTTLTPDLAFVIWENQTHVGEVTYNPLVENPRVEALRVHFNNTFTLSQVIENYGEPSHLLIDAGPGEHLEDEHYFGLWIIYLENGFALEYRSTPATNKPFIEETMKFYNVKFFSPSLIGLALSVAGIRDSDSVEEGLVSWQGYRDFMFYCEQAYPEEISLRCGTNE